MSPTVCTGDMLLLSREHGDDSARIGDIVTFPSPHDGGQAIKRVVAVAGQSVVIKDADLFVDGKPVVENYVDHASIDGVYTATVDRAGRDGVRDGRQPRDLHRLAGIRADSNGDHRRPAVAKTLVGMLTRARRARHSDTDPDSGVRDMVQLNVHRRRENRETPGPEAVPGHTSGQLVGAILLCGVGAIIIARWLTATGYRAVPFGLPDPGRADVDRSAYRPIRPRAGRDRRGGAAFPATHGATARPIRAPTVTWPR